MVSLVWVNAEPSTFWKVVNESELSHDESDPSIIWEGTLSAQLNQTTLKHKFQ